MRTHGIAHDSRLPKLSHEARRAGSLTTNYGRCAGAYRMAMISKVRALQASWTSARVELHITPQTELTSDDITAFMRRAGRSRLSPR